MDAVKAREAQIKHDEKLYVNLSRWDSADRSSNAGIRRRRRKPNMKLRRSARSSSMSLRRQRRLFVAICLG